MALLPWDTALVSEGTPRGARRLLGLVASVQPAEGSLVEVRAWPVGAQAPGVEPPRPGCC